MNREQATALELCDACGKAPRELPCPWCGHLTVCRWCAEEGRAVTCPACSHVMED